MLLMRKCDPFVCLRSFQFSLFMKVVIPMLCTTSVKVMTVDGGAGTILLWSLFHGPECFDLVIFKFNLQRKTISLF